MSRCPSALAVCAAVALVVAVDLVCRAALGRRLYDLPFQYGALRALPLFVLGASLARVRSPRRLAGWPSLALGGACAVTLVALQSLGRFDTATLALTAGLILLSDAMFGARRFGWVEAAGNVSYALFISHILVATTWFGLLHHVEPHQPAWVGWTLLAAGVVLALGVAVLFDQLIDRPLQRRLRQFRSMPTPAAV
jgi:peptidoglycan/LPS O-acetylase OafA/YrhL